MNDLVIRPASPVLILRACATDGSSRNGFVWPEAGPVTCPDWKPTADCGNGLHGWLWGEGSFGACAYDANDQTLRWLVVQVTEYIDLKNKVKFPGGNVVFSGKRDEAVAYLLANGAQGRAVLFGTATAGYSGTATAGDYGTATAGDYGTATAGDYGTATAGYSGTATAGNYGTATAGYSGTATAGNYGTIIIKRWNGKRYKFSVGHIGEDADAEGAVLVAGVAYCLNNEGQFVKA